MSKKIIRRNVFINKKLLQNKNRRNKNLLRTQPLLFLGKNNYNINSKKYKYLGGII